MYGLVSALLALGTLSLANPVPAPAASVNTCAAVSKVVSALKAQSTAAAFCTSFLKITTSTITSSRTVTSTIPASATLTTGTNTATASPVTTATTIVVSASSTSTSTVFQPTTTTTTSTVINSPTVTVTLYDCTNPGSPNAKRAAAASTTTSSKANPLASFASSALSSACRCLSLPTPATTVYVTGTASVTSTTTLQTAATATYTPTVVQTVTQTTTVVVQGYDYEPTTIINSETATSTAPAMTATATPGYCTSQGSYGNIHNQNNVYLVGTSLSGSFPFVPDYSLTNGVLQQQDNGQYLYVLDGVNGGAVLEGGSVPAGAWALHCTIAGNPGSMHDFACFNTQGVRYQVYTLDGSSNIQVGLAVPAGASGQALTWFG
ncbi:hypothetical protein LTR53_004244 [Teratosphaeriaceae sp. CCFEE 6253]|nr:hypothetical protein LTR53_004244 [Teratosphaeriaceae sp. CCFEE 6253]